MSTSSSLRRRACALLAGALLLLGTRPGSAQSIFPPTTPRYQAVLRLAQDGYADSARSSIQRIIASLPPTDPSYAEALYTSASITARTLEETRLLFTRVALDYPESPWADKAFYRLALIDYGLNQIDASLVSFRRIFNDYPTSPVIPMAAQWGSRAAFQKNDLPLACDWIRKGIAAAGSDVETKNALQYSLGRCNVGPGVQIGPPLLAESLRTVPPTMGGQTPPPAATPVKPDSAKPVKPAPARAGPADNFRVQVAAVSNKAAITRTVNALKKAGYTVWQIKAGATLVKIQAGPFATRDAASAKLAALKKIAGGKPFIVPTP